ncbi:MAG TPA: transglycosylase domain-containing protein [Solirubrobacterales bacterium]|nr:transglycosylase domain-containing protein [Solirubrobacterales bacterium]
MASRIRRRRRRQVHHVWRKVFIVIGVLVVAACVAGGIGAAWALNIWNEAPDLSSLKPVQKGRSSAIYAADGSLIGYIQSDNIRQPVASDQLPEDLKDATVSIEDKGFWQHGALDYQGIARAIWKDALAGGKPVQGASTITQQLVRNLYIQNPEDTIHRKIIEAALAEELFEAHDREWILTQYLNTAPYGTNGGQTSVGAEAAAQTYFDKPVKELGLTEAALLAGLPQAPSEYNPFLYPKAALQRRNEVLGTMEEQGYITPAEYRVARTEGLGLNPGHKYTTVKDQFLYDLVESELIERYGINTVRNGGLKAYTTINPDLQAKAENAIAESCYVCYEGGPVAGLASVSPKDGAIVALASSPPGEGEEQFNYAWQAERQPGSSFKTYVLTTAIKQGIDPETTYYDGTSPITLPIPGGGYWNVHNAEPSGGVMSLKTATTDSTNVVFAQLDLDVGPENVTQTAEEMGIEAELLSVPAEAIGGLTYGVSPLEMADGYATLASGGIHHDPTAVSKVEFPDGKVDDLLSENGERVLTEGQAYEVTKVLETVITEGTGSPYTYMGCTSEAGKTGTSEEESDAWFVGYTPMYSTAVWVGHPKTREYTGFGGPTAGPIWQNYMSAAQGSDCPDFEEPSELPDLQPFSSEHTRSSSEVGSGEEESEESEEEEKKHKKEEKEEAGEEEGEAAEEPAEEAAPPPPSPPPHVGGGVAPG